MSKKESQGVYLFDEKMELYKSIPPNVLLENIQDIELNGQITGRFTAPYKEYIEKASYYGVKEKNNFWLYSVRSVLKENGAITVNGIHIFFDDLKGTPVRDKRPTNAPASTAFTQIFEGTGWTVGQSNVTTIASARYYHQSALSAFYKALKTWNCEFKLKIEFEDGKIISKTVDLYQRISNDYGKWFEKGDKLISVVAETSKDDLYTAFIGRGKGQEIIGEDGTSTGGYGRKLKFDGTPYKTTIDGVEIDKPADKDYIEIKEATALYGYPDGRPKIGIVDFDDVGNVETLLDRTARYAIENCRPKLQLKAKGLADDTAELGEIVSIIGDMGIRYKTRIFKIKKDFLNQKILEFEFGDKVVRSASERLKEVEAKAESKEELTQTYIEAIAERLTKSYWGEDGYNYDLKADNEYKLPAGYYSFNKPIDQDPTKVIYMGAGKLMIANSKLPTGEWNWSTFGTGDGFTADLITAGILKGGKVKWNLEDGTLLIGKSTEDYSLWYDGKKIHMRDVDLDLENNETISNINEKIKNTDTKLDSSVEEINGKITSEVKEINQKLTLSDGKLESSIKTLREETEEKDNQIKQYVSDNFSTITQTDQKIETKVGAVSQEIDTKTGTLKSYVNSNFSTIAQTNNLVSAKVSKGNIISEINQSAESVKIKASKINLDGDVTLRGRFKTKFSGSSYTAVDLHGTRLDFYDPNNKSYRMGSIGTTSTLTVQGSTSYRRPILGIGHEPSGMIQLRKRYDSDSESNIYMLCDKDYQIAFHNDCPVVLYQSTMVRGKLVVGDSVDSNRQNSIYFGTIQLGGVTIEAHDYYLTLKNSRGREKNVYI